MGDAGGPFARSGPLAPHRNAAALRRFFTVSVLPLQPSCVNPLRRERYRRLMRSPSPVTLRRLPWYILGVAAPALILGAAANVVTARPDWAPSPQVRLMDRQLAAQPVDVLTLGPSIARTDIDAETLGRGLASPALSVARIGQPSAPAPVWYAILRERVYAAGFRPNLVILVVTMHSLLTTRLEDTQGALLTQHFAEPDAVLRRKALDSPWPTYIQRALESREVLRSGVLTWFRDAPAGVLFGAGPSHGAALVTQASERALGEHHVTESGPSPTIIGAGGAEAPPSHLSSPDQSFLPDIARLVAAQGGRLAVVLPPASSRRGFGFRIDPALERETLQLANDLGVAWVDLRDWTDRDGDFRDGLHLSAEAAPRFTAEMAARLTAANALGPGAPVPAVLPPPVPVRSRAGAPPAVGSGPAVAGVDACTMSIDVPEFAAFGEERLRAIAPKLTTPLRVNEGSQPLTRGGVRAGECVGRFNQRGGVLSVSSSRPGVALSVEIDPESTWVWPGSTMTWTYPRAWGGTEAAAVEAEIIVVGGADTPPPFLKIGDVELPFSGSTPRRSVNAPVTSAAVTSLTVSAPAGGGWVNVRKLNVAVGAATSVLVAAPAGRRTDLVTDAQFSPNSVPKLQIGPFEGGPRSRRVAAPWADHSHCSPVRVLEDGVRLPRAAAEGAWIAVAPVDGSDPAKNGRRYGLEIDEERRCKLESHNFSQTRTWMYPGDHFVATVTLPRLTRLDSHRAQATATQPGHGGTLHLILREGSTVRSSHEVAVADLELEARLPLDGPIRPNGRDPIEVEASLSADAAPILLSWFGLEE